MDPLRIQAKQLGEKRWVAWIDETWVRRGVRFAKVEAKATDRISALRRVMAMALEQLAQLYEVGKCQLHPIMMFSFYTDVLPECRTLDTP